MIWDHGKYDFNNDGQDEIWIVYSPQADLPEDKQFGIINIASESINIEEANIQLTGEIMPVEIVPSSGFDNHRIYDITVGDTTLSMLCQSNPRFPQPQFQFYNYWVSSDFLVDIQTNMFTNPDFAEIAQRLEDFNISLLSKVPESNKMDITLLLYLRGLTYELAGEADKAASLYLQLWQSYPDSPYAIMARAKLEAVP